MRTTSSRSPSRGASRASSDGVAMPVTETEMIRSTWSGRMPAASSAPDTACSARSSPASMNVSLVELNPSSWAYWASGSARCRVSTLTLPWIRSRTARLAPVGRHICATRSVSSSCRYRCGGSAPWTAASRVMPPIVGGRVSGPDQVRSVSPAPRRLGSGPGSGPGAAAARLGELGRNGAQLDLSAVPVDGQHELGTDRVREQKALQTLRVVDLVLAGLDDDVARPDSGKLGRPAGNELGDL